MAMPPTFNMGMKHPYETSSPSQGTIFGLPSRIPQIRPIEKTSASRLLRPTKASLAAITTKRLSGRAKIDEERKEYENERRRLAEKHKKQSNLTVPQTPKLLKREFRKSRTLLLSPESKELQEIEALRKKVQATKEKRQRYHELTTRGTSYSSNEESTNDMTRKRSYSDAKLSSGNVGVPPLRRQKLTHPIGFNLRVDQRALISRGHQGKK